MASVTTSAGISRPVPACRVDLAEHEVHRAQIERGALETWYDGIGLATSIP